MVIIHAQSHTWQWARSAIGEQGGDNSGRKIKAGINGSVYVLGNFTDDSLKFGAITLYHSGVNNSNNLFVAKYDAAGNLLFAKSLGTGDFSSFSLVLDSIDNFYVTGYYSGDSLSIGSTTLSNPAFDTTYNENMFLAKFDSLGNSIWVISNSNNVYCEGWNVDLDASGNVYVVGQYGGDSLTFDTITVFTTYYSIFHNDVNLFLAKFDSSGNTIWLKRVGGTANYARGIATDIFGNVFIAGTYYGSVMIFDTVVINNSNPGNTDVYVAKYNSSGNILWAKTEGGIDQEEGFCIRTDSYGNAFVSGIYSPGSVFSSVNLPGRGAFLVKYDYNGNFLWVKTVLANCVNVSCILRDLDVDDFGNEYITGYFSGCSITLDTTTLLNNPNVYTNSPDAVFLAKYNNNGNLLWADKGIGYGAGTSIVANKTGGVYLTGSFGRDTMWFGSNMLITYITYYTTFVSKFDNVTGIQELNHETSSNSIFPNPAANELHISDGQPEIINIKIYDVFGKLQMADLNLLTETIDVSKLNPGMYFVKVKGEKEERLLKFIKQ
jgi:hypothetical protein